MKTKTYDSTKHVVHRGVERTGRKFNPQELKDMASMCYKVHNDTCTLSKKSSSKRIVAIIFNKELVICAFNKNQKSLASIYNEEMLDEHELKKLNLFKKIKGITMEVSQ